MQLTSKSLPCVMVQLSLSVRGHRVGLLALIATPVIGAEWDDPSPRKPRPGDASSVRVRRARAPWVAARPLLNAPGVGRVWTASTPPVTKPGDRWGSWVPFPGQLQAHVIASSRLTLTEYAELVLGDEFKVFQLPDCCRSADCRQPNCRVDLGAFPPIGGAFPPPQKGPISGHAKRRTPIPS